MSNNQAFVTGGSGFLGTHLVDELLSRNWEVISMTRRPGERRPGTRAVFGDLLEPGTMELGPLRDCQVVFHFGATTPYSNRDACEDSYFRGNFEATRHLVDEAARAGVEHFVYASGVMVSGSGRSSPAKETDRTEPHGAYLLSKLFGELYCEHQRRTAGFPVTSLRLTSPYGPGLEARTVLRIFAEASLASRPIHVYGTGRRRQNFVHVKDVVRACFLAIDRHRPGLYNIGGAQAVSMRELANVMVELCSSSSEVLMSNRPDPQEGCDWDADLTKAATLLGYTPHVELEQGLKDYLRWVEGTMEA